ncbi:MAG TPA: flagellar hook-length control protein FliK, partial [Xanthobacteraceae bacterium]|nr:flagellar hook-length control protein FliK [Xanthobacteraceae bacterium]
EPGDAPAHGHAESAPDLARPPAVGGGIQASTDIQPSLTPVAPAAAQPFSAVLALTPQHPAAVSDRAVPLAGVAIEIAARVEDGQKRFEIRLDPPELGRIEVRLDVDAAGRVATHLMADRTDTLDLLRRDAPALERALQSAGLKTDDGTLQFSLRDQSFAGRDPGFARIAPPAQLIVPDADGAPLDAALRRYGQLMGLGGGVDIRV